MKRFLLGALGALGLAGMTLAQSGPSMPRADAPVMLQHQPTVNSAPVSNDRNSCAPVNNCDDGCGRDGGLGGGVSALYLRPHFTSNPSLSLTITDSTTITDPVTAANTSTTRIINGTPDFDYDWSVSPRIWIGFQGECLGARARWFHFDQG